MQKIIGPGFFLLLAAASTARAAEGAAAPETAAVAGRVVDEQGVAVAGVAVRALAYRLTLETATDDAGRFSFEVPTAPRDLRKGLVLTANGGGRVGYDRLPYDPAAAPEAIEVALKPARRLEATVTGPDGQPVAGAAVAAQVGFTRLASASTDDDGRATLLLPPGAKLRSVFAEKRGAGFDYRVASSFQQPDWEPEWLTSGRVALRFDETKQVRLRLAGADGKPAAGTEVYVWLIKKPDERDEFNGGGATDLFRATTDDQGRAVIDTIPAWQEHSLTIWPTGDEWVHRRFVVEREQIGGEEILVTLERPSPVRGRALLPDGRPAEGVTVSGRGAGYGWDHFNGWTKTDSEGRFELLAYPDELLMLVAGDDEWAAPAIDGLITKPGEAIEGLEFRLQLATRVFGRATVGDGGEPIAGAYLSLSQQGRDLRAVGGKLPKPTDPDRRNLWIGSTYFRSAQTDDQGRFEFSLGPGEYTLSGLAQAEPEKFTVTDQSEIEINLVSEREELAKLTGRVVAGDPPQPVAGAEVYGVCKSHRSRRTDLSVVTDAEGRFTTERESFPMIVFARSGDGRERGVVEIEAEDSEVTIRVAPTASASGVLVDSTFDEPAAGRTIEWGVPIDLGDGLTTTRNGGRVTTDADGSFSADNLIVGGEYQFSLVSRRPSGVTYSRVATLTPGAPRPHDLGRPETGAASLDKLIERDLNARQSAAERFATVAERAAERGDDPVIVVFLDEDSPAVPSWYRAQLVEPATRDLLAGCEVLVVNTTGDGAFRLAEMLGGKLFTTPRPLVVLYGDAGRIESIDGDDLLDGERIDTERLAEFLEEQFAE